MNNRITYPAIETLIPHRAPMLLVDKVIDVDGLKTTTAFHVNKPCIFLQNDHLSETGMIENIAQTSFIFLSYFFGKGNKSLWAANKQALGFISTISTLNISFLPTFGDELISHTTAGLVFDSDFLKICTISGQIHVNDNLALDTVMKMVLQIKKA